MRILLSYLIRFKKPTEKIMDYDFTQAHIKFYEDG
jgi:hypothetical protein